MPLPSYINQARPQLTNQRWQNMRPPQRRKIGNQVRQQQANVAARAPAAPAAAAPSDGGSGPYTAPQTNSTGPVDNPYGYTGTVPGTSDYANHPFFDPNSQYLVPGVRGDLQNPSKVRSDLSNVVGQQYGTVENPEGYYLALMNKLGLGGLDARSQTAQGLYKDYQGGYAAAQFTTPNLFFPEYMGGQNVQGLIGNMSYNQTGIDPQQWSDRTRWGMRGY